jgi:hypothetical protein
MTGNGRPEVEQIVAPAQGGEEATSNPGRGDGGWHPARRCELSVGTGGNDGGTTAIDLERAVKFGWCADDCSFGDFPDPTPDGSLVHTSRIPSAPNWGARSMTGLHAAADRCTAIDAGELGLRVQ